jgi:hypothetical protein
LQRRWQWIVGTVDLHADIADERTCFERYAYPVAHGGRRVDVLSSGHSLKRCRQRIGAHPFFIPRFTERLGLVFEFTARLGDADSRS